MPQDELPEKVIWNEPHVPMQRVADRASCVEAEMQQHLADPVRYPLTMADLLAYFITLAQLVRQAAEWRT